MNRRTALVALIGSSLFALKEARSADNHAELVELLKVIDARQSNTGDFRALAYIEQKEKGKVDMIYEALVYRRSTDQKFMMLFTKPRTSQGQGYLRADQNLWFYDPSLGRWEHRTERERLGGTNTRRSDFDASRLADEYDATDSGTDKLGTFTTRVLTLNGKPGRDLAFPSIKLWVDKETKNVLKRQEYALSGRLLRTSYFTKWRKVFSESKQGEVWYAEETRRFDEVEKGNSTFVLLKSVDLSPLEPNQFTKAWLEAKAR